MQRGEVWWANLPAPAGRRPVLLLSRDSAYLVRSGVLVAPLTGTIRDTPVEVPVGAVAALETAPVDLLVAAVVPFRLRKSGLRLPSRVTSHL